MALADGRHIGSMWSVVDNVNVSHLAYQAAPKTAGKVALRALGYS